MKAAQTNKRISETINCPLSACFDLHPDSGTQPCFFKNSHCLFLFSSCRASRAKASRLPRILKQITSTLPSINTLESRERTGQIKHHRDPRAHCLFWWAAIMFSWRQQPLEPTRAKEWNGLNCTGSMKVRETWTIWCRYSAGLFNYCIRCTSVTSYVFTFQVLVHSSGYSCNSCIDCETVSALALRVERKRSGRPWAVGEHG